MPMIAVRFIVFLPFRSSSIRPIAPVAAISNPPSNSRGSDIGLCYTTDVPQRGEVITL
jgi:hypothetical protein